jgi:hypothetical protein
MCNTCLQTVAGYIPTPDISQLQNSGLDTEKHEILGGTIAYFDTTRTAKKTTPTIRLFLCVFVAAVTILPSHCLATINRYICKHTD